MIKELCQAYLCCGEEVFGGISVENVHIGKRLQGLLIDYIDTE